MGGVCTATLVLVCYCGCRHQALQHHPAPAALAIVSSCRPAANLCLVRPAHQRSALMLLLLTASLACSSGSVSSLAAASVSLRYVHG